MSRPAHTHDAALEGVSSQPKQRPKTKHVVASAGRGQTAFAAAIIGLNQTPKSSNAPELITRARYSTRPNSSKPPPKRSKTMAVVKRCGQIQTRRLATIKDDEATTTKFERVQARAGIDERRLMFELEPHRAYPRSTAERRSSARRRGVDHNTNVGV